jgi:hypothetical protein
VSIAKPLTDTVLPSFFVSVSVWVPLLYVPPVTVTSDNVSNRVTLNESPSFLVKVRTAFELFHDAPVKNSSVLTTVSVPVVNPVTCPLLSNSKS